MYAGSLVQYTLGRSEMNAKLTTKNKKSCYEEQPASTQRRPNDTCRRHLTARTRLLLQLLLLLLLRALDGRSQSRTRCAGCRAPQCLARYARRRPSAMMKRSIGQSGGGARICSVAARIRRSMKDNKCRKTLKLKFKN